MPASVQLATILLTDLVASTELASAVGPKRWEELLDQHFVTLREAIHASGGTEVKNTGDGLMVAFDSASAAVLCAVSMQQLVERRQRLRPPRLHVRIGLAAGESTVRDGDYFGLPSIEAARLCASAPSDGILASPAVRMLAGRASGERFESVGELELKGIPDPVEAFAVSWQPLAEESATGVGRWPLPQVLQSVPAISYVGRSRERERIERARSAARDGERQAVLLCGEPGIGKSRLAAYAAHAASAEGFAVCWGGCSEDLAAPYEPWIEVCSELVEHAPAELLSRYVERHGGELGRLARNLPRRVPDLPAPQSSDPETERFLLFAAVAGLLRTVAEAVPLCVVLDDLHWADAQTVALLKHMVRTINNGALQLIATYRDSDLYAEHPLSAVLADLAQSERVQRIALRGLRVEEVGEIVSATAGHELDEHGAALARAIAADTRGNPFFVGELLRSLMESGTLGVEDDTGAWSIARASQVRLPQSVRDVIDGRVRRLGGEAREILTHGAVVGQAFDVELLTELLDLDESSVLDQLEAAVAASVLAESGERVGRFSFEHALIRQSLYESLGATRRARMHHRVALALEQLSERDGEERLSELAMHWRLATASVDAGRAAGYARRAGERALASLAPAEAARLFADAIELSGDLDSVERCQALIGLGEAQRQSGDGSYRATLRDASRLASELGDAELAANAALANNRGDYNVIGEVDEQQVQAIERALELDDPPHAARRARLLALQAQELGWDEDFKRRWALAEEAVELARATEDPRTLADVLRFAFYALWSPETLELRKTIAGELVNSATATGDPAMRFWAHAVQFDALVESADIARAQPELRKLELTADQLGQPILSWIATYNRGLWALQLGEVALAEQLTERAFQLGQQAEQPDAVLVYGIALSAIRIYQGRGEEVVAMLEQSVEAYPRLPGWRAALAQTYALTGRHADAAKIVKDAATDGFQHILHDQTHTTALALYADAAAQARVTEAAAILYELIEPWRDQYIWNGISAHGHARMWLAMLAATLDRPERADRDFAFACEFHQDNGLVMWSAYSHLCWGEALARRGELDRSRAQGAQALKLTREYGYGVFEERAAALVDGGSPARLGSSTTAP